ncbi:MAG: hypothetical protein K2P57_13525 [Burkholderiales bacterium]|nr:hypothetical protein [Burkholderiales bacterium]
MNRTKLAALLLLLSSAPASGATLATWTSGSSVPESAFLFQGGLSVLEFAIRRRA